jgi:DNA-binding transcriptional ArsR family regulator
LLDSLITSKTRIKLLLKFFSNPKNSAYLRSLATEFGESTNSIRLELNRLSEAGLLNVEDSGNKVRYKANEAHPLFPEVSSLVKKYLGIDQLIEGIIQKVGLLKRAYVLGDYAIGQDKGLIELLLVGSPNKEYVATLINKVEVLIKRRVKVMIISFEQYEELYESLNLKDCLLIWEERP